MNTTTINFKLEKQLQDLLGDNELMKAWIDTRDPKDSNFNYETEIKLYNEFLYELKGLYL